jgi:sucrose-phosphate synthase
MVDGPDSDSRTGLYLMSLSVHGLVRGTDIELGRDSDTGGQVSYVVDQARVLSTLPEVHKVDLITRQIWDRRVDEVYAEPLEPLTDVAQIIRLPFGPRRYLYKETLWPYLPGLVDQIMRHIRAQQRAPDLIHGHYADAGFVGSQVAKILGVPFVFTGHSLGRVKLARLLETGQDRDTLEKRYRFEQRIEAEERALETAALVIASTRQEVQDQYELYDHYQPERKRIIPPGVDLSRFLPPQPGDEEPPIALQVRRFLADPVKPLILAMARPDERKNFSTLVEAYGTHPTLRERANLLLVAGNREDIRELGSGPRRVLTEILHLVDRYDLYGVVAYPKRHAPEDVPELYRMATRSRGVFVNPALTEPFGLTIIEAAASGLPIIATNDGGPQDIIGACGNGLLVDPRDPEALGQAISDALDDQEQWDRWSAAGVRGAHEHFSWESHARRYLEEATKAVGGIPRLEAPRALTRASRLPRIDRVIVTDIDNTLTGNEEALLAFVGMLEEMEDHVGFAVATGRPLDLALEALAELNVPRPDMIICATGTGIHYGEPLVPDRSWRRQIDYRWEPDRVSRALGHVKGLSPLRDEPPTPFRLRFRRTGPDAPDLPGIRRILRKEGLRVTAILDNEVDLDVIPIRASPGLAIRFLSYKWSLAPHRFLVAGDSGNDSDMLAGETLGVVVANHSPELDLLRGHPRLYFAQGDHAWGVLEGIEHYDFLDTIRVPDLDSAPIPDEDFE